MATVSLAPLFKPQYFDSNGNPLAGGKVYTYQSGTTTPQSTYTDSSGVTTNANPVVLDANGEANIWLDVSLSYKFVIQDSSGSTLKTVDNVIGLLTNNTVATASLQDGAVTAVKLADGAVTSAKLASDASVDANRPINTNNIKDSSITTAKVADGNITLAKLAAALLPSLVPTGAILPYAGSAAPTGFLLCNGDPVSRTTYATLFTAIGTAHGDGTKTASGASSGFAGTHFNLPDYRGRFLRGVDGGAANDPDRASRTAQNTGGNTGDAVGTLQADQITSHTHGMTGFAATLGGGPDVVFDTSNTTASAKTTLATGGNETRPKNSNVNFIIKT